MASHTLNSQCPASGMGTVDSLVTTLVQTLFVAQCSLSSPNYWPSDYGDKALLPGALDGFDFVVIGAGSGGSVVASRLSENPNYKVLVLEQGGDPPVESEIPNLTLNLQRTDFVFNYIAEPNNGKSSLALKNESTYWPQGKCIGGSSAISAMFYVRGNRKEYDRWREKGNPGWGWDDVLPYFEKSVKPVGNSSVPLGYETVLEFRRFNRDVQEMIYAGAKELGEPHVKRFEEGSQIGYSNLPGNVQDGQRVSTGKSYLGRVAKRPNLRVIKNAQVTRINFSKSSKKVESISFLLRYEHKLNMSVKKEYILSAGTIESPKLLLLSGVGPKEHLSSLNLPVIHNLKIGDNLQDRVFVGVFFKVHANASVTEKDNFDNLHDYLIHRDGPLSSINILPLTGFVNSDEDSKSPYPDIEYHHCLFRRGELEKLRQYDKNVGFKESYMPYIEQIVKEGHLMIVYVDLAHPKSTGHIRLRSANYADQPKIIANHLNEQEDVETVLRGIRRQMKMETTKAYKDNKAEIQHIPIEECDQFEFKSDNYWRCYIKYFSSTNYHHTSTVKMGPSSDPTACVDSRLKLYGVDNFRVVDASVMPDLTSCNTNAPIVMIAEKAADFIAEDWREHKKADD